MEPAIQEFKGKLNEFTSKYNTYLRLLGNLYIDKQTNTYYSATESDLQFKNANLIKMIKMTDQPDINKCKLECDKYYDCTGAVLDTWRNQCSLFSSNDNETIAIEDQAQKGKYQLTKNSRMNAINSAYKELLMAKTELDTSMDAVRSAAATASADGTTYSSLDARLSQVYATYNGQQIDAKIGQINEIQREIQKIEEMNTINKLEYNKNASIFVGLAVGLSAMIYGIYSFSNGGSVALPTAI